MSYNERYTGLVAQAHKDDQRRELPRLTDTLSAGLVRSFVARQGAYLSWSFALILMQLLEVLILAYGHFIFLPPSSLRLLRILSALNLLGVLSALVIRFQPPLCKDEKELLLALCRTIFISASLLALSLLGALIWITTLTDSAPPIFRAVILSGIIAFPFDAAGTFLLYNARRIRPAGARLRLRIPALLVYLSSLLPLYFGLPLLYLLLKLTPHIFLALYLWRRLSNRRIAAFFERAAHAERGQIPRFLKTLIKPLLLAVCFEASFLALYSRLATLDSNIAVTLFVAHKAVHLVTVLGLKLDFIVLRRMQRAAAVHDDTVLRRVTAFFFFGSLIYTAIVLAALAPLLLERAGLFWMSAKGDYLHLSTPLLVLIALLVWLRASAIGLACGASLSQIRGRLFLLTLVMSLAPSAYLLTSGRFLFSRYSTESTFAYLLAVDLLCALAVSFSLIAALAEAARCAKHTGLESIIERLARRPGPLLFIEFWPEVSPSMFVSDAGIKGRLRPGELLAPWGRNCILVTPSDASRCAELKLQLLTEFSSMIKELLASEELSLRAAFDRLSPGPLSAADMLYRAAFARRYLHRPSDTAAEQLRNAVWNRLDPRIRVIDFGAQEWNAVDDPELREQAVSYAAAVVKNGPLSVELWKKKGHSGFFHLNERCKPAKLCYLPPEHRNEMDLLRQSAFRLNLASALAAMDQHG